jgi:hypothetical protein
VLNFGNCLMVCPSWDMLIRNAKAETLEKTFDQTLSRIIFFCNLIEFLINQSLKIQYLLHLRSKNFQITFIKSYSPRLFLSNFKSALNIPLQFLFFLFK